MVGEFITAIFFEAIFMLLHWALRTCYLLREVSYKYNNILRISLLQNMNVLFDLINSIFVRIFGITYKWVDQNMISSIFNFLKTFEYAIIICCAIGFLLVTVFIMLRQARKLPKSYIVEVMDVYGQRVTPEGLRLVFATYEAAESYARLYRSIYNEQYNFRVIGLQE